MAPTIARRRLKTALLVWLAASLGTGVAIAQAKKNTDEPAAETAKSADDTNAAARPKKRKKNAAPPAKKTAATPVPAPASPQKKSKDSDDAPYDDSSAASDLPAPRKSGEGKPAASSASVGSAAPSTTGTSAKPTGKKDSSLRDFVRKNGEPSDQKMASAPVISKGFSLRRCVSLAESNFPRIAEARAKTSTYRAQLSEARSAPFSQWTLSGGVGLAPTVYGTALYSPNTEVSLSTNLGLGWQASLSGSIPLWTFGKITNTIDAAESQVKLGEQEELKERNQVRLDVRRAYFALQFARTSRSLLDTAAEQLDQAIDRLQQTLDDGEGDEIDMFKLRTFRAEIDGRRSETQRLESTAMAGLRFLTGVNGDFDIDSNDLRPAKHKLGPVLRYLEAARVYRPDLAMVRAGIMARKSLLELARSRMYPDIALLASGTWQRAPEISDQLNPFIRDDANYLRYGFAIGMRWTLDFVPALARVRQAQAQLEQTEQIERLALGGAGLEVETAYAEAVDAEKRETSYGQAESYARKWMIAISEGIDIGTQEEKDLVDPARQFAIQRVSHLTAIMDLNVALSRLALTTGWDDIAPGGV